MPCVMNVKYFPGWIVFISLLALVTIQPSLIAETQTEIQDSSDTKFLPLEDFSSTFLGIYRKIMVIEDEIKKHSQKYDVDIDLALAVCLYESGGNHNLNSHAGAQGYFQVMPRTFRSLRVDTNIEAGIKYLSQMIKRFNREDYALAAYNGGPSRVTSGRPPLETLQYILGVGQYRNVLKLYHSSIRHHASQLELEEIREGDDWWTISKRVGISVLQLRMHNPFLATRALRVGQSIAHPPSPRDDLFEMVENNLTYRTRHGDHYLHLAFVLEVTRDAIRDTNDLWRLQVLPEGQTLQIPLEWKGKHKEHTIKVGDDLEMIAKTYKSDPWRIIRDNSLFWDKPLTSGMVLKIRSTPPKPTYITHRVSSGDTLGALASRYGTTVRTIQNANNLGRKTLIRIGQRLRITTRKTDETRPESELTYITHRVSRGDTLGALASRYSTTVRTIQNANNLGRKTLLQIGQRLRIPTQKTG